MWWRRRKPKPQHEHPIARVTYMAIAHGEACWGLVGGKIQVYPGRTLPNGAKPIGVAKCALAPDGPHCVIQQPPGIRPPHVIHS